MMSTHRKSIIYILLGFVIIAIAIFSYQQNDQERAKVKESNYQDTSIKKEEIEKILPVITIEPKDPPVITVEIKAKQATEVSSSVIITGRGDDLLVLVNKNIRLSQTYEPSDLISIKGLIGTTNGGMTLRKETADAIQKMSKDAKRAHVNLIVLSAYRSYWSQDATFNGWVASAGLAAAETFSARPGHSQHQLGTTVDFTSELVNLGLAKGFSTSKEGFWLFNNAYKYGFVLSYPEGKENITGYTYEPWHWRYIGVENAQQMKELGLILEEYLRKFGVV